MAASETGASPLPLLSIGLVSATALAYEILLMRLFSIVQWHHFAYMIISLALLGYGISGTFLTLTRKWLLARFPAAYIGSLALFGMTVVLSYRLAQRIPFNPEEIAWDWHQLLSLAGIYLLLSLPFLFASNAIVLAMMARRASVAGIYAVDLAGAGAGSLGIVALLYATSPTGVLALLGGLGGVAALVAVWELRLPARWPLSILLTLLLVPWAYFGGQTQLLLSPYKPLRQLLRIEGTRAIDRRSSPLGLLTLVETSRIPLRYAPGLSLNAASEPPPQLALFTDAAAMTALTEYHGQRERLAYLDQLTSALPYHLFRPRRVLILGAGAGMDVLQALYHQVPRIDAVELNTDVIQLVKDRAAFSGDLYSREPVHIHNAEARGYLADGAASFDLIQMAQLDAFNASAAGLYALNETYLYTVEALRTYLEHLNPGGYLSITRWIKMPPRDTLKLFATAVAAMRPAGTGEMARRLVLIRGWQTSTLLVKNGPVTAPEIRALRRFCASRSFDLAYYPGIEAAVANRYNVLRQPYFFLAARSLLSDSPSDFIARYKFNLAPASDDRPYFFHFFRWSALPEIVSLRGRGGIPLLEWGYLILIATLIQAVAASLLLIVLPLWLQRRGGTTGATAVRCGQVLVYFSAIGLAFLFIEIAAIQKFMLFLHHPLYAASVVLSAFLVFAGIGSAWSGHRPDRRWTRRGLLWPVAGIIAMGLAYLFLLDPLFGWLMTWPIHLKIPLAVILIAPLAFCMGMPFPLAVARLGQLSPEQIPWAWAINGCASVISAVLATLLAIHFGFSWVVLMALLLYLVAMFSFPTRAVAGGGRD